MTDSTSAAVAESEVGWVRSVPPRALDLDPFDRMLLTADGTVTTLLEACTREPIITRTTRQAGPATLERLLATVGRWWHPDAQLLELTRGGTIDCPACHVARSSHRPRPRVGGIARRTRPTTGEHRRPARPSRCLSRAASGGTPPGDAPGHPRDRRSPGGRSQRTPRRSPERHAGPSHLCHRDRPTDGRRGD